PTGPAHVYAAMRIPSLGLLVLVACSGREPEAERTRLDPAPVAPAPSPPIAPAPTPPIAPAPTPPVAPDPTPVPEPAAIDAPPIEAASGRFSVMSRARQHGGHHFTVRPVGITFELPWPHTDEIATGAQLSRMRE